MAGVDDWDIDSVIRELRDDPNKFMHFLWAMGPAIMGLSRWVKDTKTAAMSSFVNVNDEGFLLLAIDNYHDRWEAIAQRMRDGVSLVRF